MGKPETHIPVKLVVGLISGKPENLELARNTLERKFGALDDETALLDFSYTNYYEGEFGKGLKRKFLSFKKLIAPASAYKIKRYTNEIERRLSRKRARTVNIDPGYIALSKLVLFTTKDGSHRIYLHKGIFADIELMFEHKTFRPLEWTYPDYRSREYVNFFNSVRAQYVDQLKTK
ncbi:DUF4416 family protein [Candidatus Omnitrophota bacterium]